MEWSVGFPARFPAPHPTESPPYSSLSTQWSWPLVPSRSLERLKRPCVGWFSLSDGLDVPICQSALSAASKPRHTQSRVHSVSVLCFSRSPSRQGTESNEACPVLGACWRGVPAGLTPAAASSQGAEPRQPEHAQDPRMHLLGPGDSVDIQPGLGQAV